MTCFYHILSFPKGSKPHANYIIDTNAFNPNLYWQSKIKDSDSSHDDYYELSIRKILAQFFQEKQKLPQYKQFIYELEKYTDEQDKNFIPMYSKLWKTIADNKSKNELLINYIFEDVRKETFPNNPSRRTCIYLLHEDHVAYPENNPFRLISNNLIDRYLVKVEAVSCYKEVFTGDATFLNCNTDSLAVFWENAAKYWKSEHTDTPMKEVLFEGKLRVSEILTKL